MSFKPYTEKIKKKKIGICSRSDPDPEPGPDPDSLSGSGSADPDPDPHQMIRMRNTEYNHYNVVDPVHFVPDPASENYSSDILCFYKFHLFLLLLLTARLYL